MTSITGSNLPTAPSSDSCSDTELLSTIFDLSREVTSVLDLDELLAKIPQLIGRLTPFSVFAVYLLDERRGDLSIAYAVGYPEDIVTNFRLPVGQGIWPARRSPSSAPFSSVMSARIRAT